MQGIEEKDNFAISIYLWLALSDFLPELVEASSFSPEAGKTAMIKELTADLFDDHSDFEAIFQQISNLSADSAEWLERVNELGSLVREHARKEEDELFPPARRELDQTRAEEIGRQIQERRVIRPNAHHDQERES